MTNNNMKCKNKKGFFLITAIFTILFIAVLTAMVLNLSGKSVQETLIQYKGEQATLYAKSYTEMAIMAATANDCINDLTGSEGTGANVYNIYVKVSYVGNEVLTLAGCGAADTFGGAIAYNKSKGNIIVLDTYVTYTDTQSINNNLIKYYRRTVQKL